MENNSTLFILTTCQIGFEQALKSEMKRLWPDFKFSYSRPGFLTFKLPADFIFDAAFDLKSVFARTYAFSIGKVKGDALDERIQFVRDAAASLSVSHIHVWKRQATAAKSDAIDFMDEQVLRITKLLENKKAFQINKIPTLKEKVLSVILVEENEWWLGSYIHTQAHKPWPAGVYQEVLPPEVPSRAYLKLNESIAWARFRLRSDDTALEFGSSPGGASYALLQKGLTVIGVDPGDMAESVLSQSKFHHIRLQATQLKPSMLDETPIQWIFSDMNVSPTQMLKPVGQLIKHQSSSLLGAVLTWKLKDLKLADEIPEWTKELKKMGFVHIKVTQLFHNRQEVCVAALTARGLDRRMSHSS